jgi:hypothetical protein
MTHDTRCEKHKKYTYEGCHADICEDITVNVPISVCAHSEVCDVQFDCLGPTIEENICQENQGCNRFNVIQRINLHIPLKFKAECDVSEGLVDFHLHECKKHEEQH